MMSLVFPSANNSKLYATNHSVVPTVMKYSIRYYITTKIKNNKIEHYGYDYSSLICIILFHCCGILSWASNCLSNLAGFLFFVFRGKIYLYSMPKSHTMKAYNILV